MFGLGGKTAEDAVWLTTAKAHAEKILEISKSLGSAADAIADDELRGWIQAGPVLVGLPDIEWECKKIKKSFKEIGKPSKQSEWRPVDDMLNAFMDAVTLAAHWGKHHYNDQVGGPGERAIHETGFAQRAALKRIRGNGKKFVENASSASMFGNLFCANLAM